jgi:hypothetical protein
MFGYHNEMFKSIAEGRRDQIRKSAGSRKEPKKLRKKRIKKTIKNQG